MHELKAVLGALEAAEQRGLQCALATVVSVEGSSYRRPGARMLIAEDGVRTGTISAGCLEGDVVQHAKRAISTGAAKLVEYDTASASEEAAWGLGLGCGGTVRVLVEPVREESLHVQALRSSCETDGVSVTMATVYEVSPDSSQIAVGAHVAFSGDQVLGRENITGDAAETLVSEVRSAARQGVRSVEISLRAGSVVAKVFIETLQPPVPVTIFGADNDALPVVQLAHGLGWRTEVIDPQARAASNSRFQMADRVVLSRPEEVEAQVRITPRTMVLIMSHNYSHDLKFLRFVLASPARYIGVLGPRRRTERLLGEISEHGNFGLDEGEKARLHYPAGLDIGADTPVEIAISILAEMRAVLGGRQGGLLRDRQGSIYDRDDVSPAHR